MRKIGSVRSLAIGLVLLTGVLVCVPGVPARSGELWRVYLPLAAKPAGPTPTVTHTPRLATTPTRTNTVRPTNTPTWTSTAQPSATSTTSLGGTVYITATGNRYHRAGCRYLGSSAIPKTCAWVDANGYTACSVCDPYCP
jgi:hypothetical protein